MAHEEHRPPPVEPRWGLGDAILGLFGSLVFAAIVQTIVLVATGHTDPDDLDLSLGMVALLQLPLWAGLVGVPWWATATKGNGLRHDLGVHVERPDIGRGILLGLVTQLVLVPLLYLPIQLVDDFDADELSEPARELTDRAANAADTIALVVIVGIGAPIAEEIFYRGLLQRSLLRRTRPWLAIGITSVVFAASHLQPLQFPALVLFGVVAGVVAHRTGRLGPAIVMHLVFNLTAVTSLLVSN